MPKSILQMGLKLIFIQKVTPVKLLFVFPIRGVGIAEDEKAKIFDRFYRIEDEETRSSKGTGVRFIFSESNCKNAWGENYLQKITHLAGASLNYTLKK